MATRKEISATVQSRDNRELAATQAKVTQVVWDKTDRSKNAMRTLGMWLLFTFVSVFIPFAHWILVPSLLVASFVLALEKLNEASRSEGGTGECPKCHQSFRIQPSKWSSRLTDNCEHCQTDVEMTFSQSISA